MWGVVPSLQGSQWKIGTHQPGPGSAANLGRSCVLEENVTLPAEVECNGAQSGKD